MRATRVTLVFLTVLVGGAFVLWKLAGRETRADAALPTAVAPAPAPTDAPAPAPPVSGAIERTTAEPTRAEVAPALPSAEAPAPPNAEMALQGRVIVTDTHGRELTDLDGEFSLGLWRGDHGSTLSVSFFSGQWSTTASDPGSLEGLSVMHLVAGGRVALVDHPAERVDTPADGELTVRAHYAPASILRVVDAGSGADLAGIELVRVQDFPDDDAAHPGPDFESRVVARDLVSPIVLDPHSTALIRWPLLEFVPPVLVGCAGFAWARVEIDFERGGERTVALVRGADLTLGVRGVTPNSRARLRLRAAGVAAPVLDAPLKADGVLELGGLTPGDVRIAAEIGEWYRSPRVLGEMSVTLRAGERQRVELALGAPPAFETATAGGIVHVHRAWNMGAATVVMNLLDTPLEGFAEQQSFGATRVESAREGFDAFRWSCERMQVGRYELGLVQPQFSVPVELPTGGRADFELVVPAPAELLVRVVDDATGEAVVTDELAWHPRYPEGATGGRLERAVRDEARGGYLIRAPAAPIQLTLWSMDFLPYDDEVDLSRGVQELTLRLQRACGIEISLRCGDTRLPIPEEWEGEPTAVVGAGETRLTSFGNLTRLFVVSEPGTYAIDPPKVPGYAKPPAQRIEVLAGRVTEHAVELELEHP
ncbi:MAG: hypothetical protein FJ299_15995 [Planctomycetes bacterium]|nr:hypothetical protein [Planctomycetota bacterium]